MTIKMDTSEYQKWVTHDVDNRYLKAPDEVKAILKESAEWVKDKVKDWMPVDTGAARARWGEEYGDGIWRVLDGGFTIDQGASLEPYEYIERLNEGWSQQAPAGFLDTAAQYGEYKLADDLERELSKYLEGK